MLENILVFMSRYFIAELDRVTIEPEKKRIWFTCHADDAHNIQLAIREVFNYDIVLKRCGERSFIFDID